MFHNTFVKIQTQSSTAKKSKSNKFRSKDLKLVNKKIFALLHINKSGKISCQDKKKKYFKKNQDQKSSTLAMEDNVIENIKNQNN